MFSKYFRFCFLIPLFVFSGCSAHAKTVRYYEYPDGKKVSICKDNDGYLVEREDGGGAAYGTGYEWEDVEQESDAEDHYDEIESEGSCSED